METKKNHEIDTLSFIFKSSLLVIPMTIAAAVILGTVVGIDHGWAMPAWSDGSKMYGIDAILSYIIIFGIAFRWVYIPIIVFQIWYIAHKVISTSIRKTNNCD